MKDVWLPLSTPKQASPQVSGRTDRNYTALKIPKKLLLKSYQPVNFEYNKSVGFRSRKRSCQRYRLFLLTPNTRQTALTPSPSLSACKLSTMRESGVFR